METVKLFGFDFKDFGSNNYTCGAKMASRYCSSEDEFNYLMDKIIDPDSHTDYEVFLNPSAPCADMEIFVFYSDDPKCIAECVDKQHNAVKANRICDAFDGKLFGIDLEEYDKVVKEVRENYIPWYENEYHKYIVTICIDNWHIANGEHFPDLKFFGIIYATSEMNAARVSVYKRMSDPKFRRMHYGVVYFECGEREGVCTVKRIDE